MRKSGYIIFIVLFFVILVIPFVGLFAPGSGDAAQAAEKRELAPMPALRAPDGALNVSYLGELGEWFEDHFGFRDELVTANSMVRGTIFGSGAGDEVIIGNNGWLYYSGTTDDFVGRDLMSARELFDAAHNLRLMQDYVEDRNCTFLFVVAANKNSLYPENMPYTYLKGTHSNAAALWPYLEADEIRSIDLHNALLGKPDLYFERDTHWNGKGALIGYNAIMDGLALSHESYAGTRWMWRDDHKGDLDEMLLPSAWIPETEYYLDTRFTYTYEDGTPESMRDPLIETSCSTGTGRLYMFRDSFSDSLIPLLSQHFRHAVYSMYTPWNLPDAVEDAGTNVVIEIVERNLADLLNSPAIVPAPAAPDVLISAGQAMTGTVHARSDGPYVRISGRVDADLLTEKSEIVVRIADGQNQMRSYVPFYTSNEERLGNSFCAYVPADGFSENRLYVEICAGESYSQMQAVYAGEVQLESGGQNS